MPRQARTVAKRRIELDQLQNRSDVETAPTIEEVAVQLREHISVAVATLGTAAAAGDVQAAKTILDFVRAADQDKASTKGTDTLKAIAEIRGKSRGPTTERALAALNHGAAGSDRPDDPGA